MKTITLTQGKVALVDDEDYELVSSYVWHFNVYAKRKSRKIEGSARNINMHTFIMGRKSLDHINRNKLDNRRSNLRVCTPGQNMANRAPYHGKFKGVSWNKKHKSWVAQLQVNRHAKHIGYFKTAKDAARAYDERAKETWGEFACLNFAPTSVR